MSLGFKKFGSTPSGTISGGGVSQILGVGMVDSHFVGPSDYSFFRSKIKKYNNLAYDVISQAFMGNITWGHEVSLTANKTPDILARVVAVIDRPGIYGRYNSKISGSSGSSRGSRPSRVSRRYKPRQVARQGMGYERKFPSNSKPRRTGSSRPSRGYKTTRYAEPAYADDSFDANSAFWDEVDDWEENYDDGYDVAPPESDDVPEVYAHWVNHLGHAAVARATITLAGMVGQCITGRYMNAFAELAGTVGKEQDNLIGTYDTQAELINASMFDERLYVDIPFTCTRFTGRHLPLVSMRFHSAGLSLALTPLHKLIKVSAPNVEVLKTSDNQPITKQDVEAFLDIEYMFLDLHERRRFAKAQFEMTWEQLQVHEATYSGLSVRAPLSFRHPSRALIFMVQRKSLDDQNDTFDYGAPVPNEDPILHAKLVVNSAPRYDREGVFFRKVMPLLHWPRTLKRGVYIYTMPFGLDPTSEMLNGMINFSRSDGSVLNLEMHPSMADESFTLYVYNMVVNVVTFKRGLVHIEYQ